MKNILIIVNVVTKWTNLTKNQEMLIYMVKTFVQIVMSSTIYVESQNGKRDCPVWGFNKLRRSR